MVQPDQLVLDSGLHHNDNVMMVLVRFSSFHNLDASGLLDRIDSDDNLDACLRSGTISSWNLNRTEV